MATENDNRFKQNILTRYCPKNLTPYEIADMTYYLKKQYKLSQKDVAEHIGVSSKSITNYLKQYENEIKQKYN